MKLITVILQDKDSDTVTEALVQAGFSITRMASTGGFLRKGNVTLMIGLEPEQINPVVALLKQHCKPSEGNQYAATVFVMNMPEYLKV